MLVQLLSLVAAFPQLGWTSPVSTRDTAGVRVRVDASTKYRIRPVDPMKNVKPDLDCGYFGGYFRQNTSYPDVLYWRAREEVLAQPPLTFTAEAHPTDETYTLHVDNKVLAVIFNWALKDNPYNFALWELSTLFLADPKDVKPLWNVDRWTIEKDYYNRTVLGFNKMVDGYSTRTRYTGNRWLSIGTMWDNYTTEAPWLYDGISYQTCGSCNTKEECLSGQILITAAQSHSLFSRFARTALLDGIHQQCRQVHSSSRGHQISTRAVILSLKTLLRSHRAKNKAKSEALKPLNKSRTSTQFPQKRQRRLQLKFGSRSQVSVEPGLTRIFSTPKLRETQAPYHILYRSHANSQPKLISSKLRRWISEQKLWPAMKCFVQILTTPTADTPGTTLLLHFDNKRYLIGNISEGTQRACVQMGVKMLKMSEIFITGRTDWATTGGLLGMILTVADSWKSAQSAIAETEKQQQLKKRKDIHQTTEVQESSTKGKEYRSKGDKKTPPEPEGSKNGFSIFGASNLNHTIATARRFIFRTGAPITIHELKNEGSQRDSNETWAPTWADENVRVWAMSIVPLKQTSTPGPHAVAPKRSQLENEAMQNEDNLHLAETEQERLDRYDQLRRGVVASMFNSDWRLDALVEMPLKDVQIPAEIFVKNPETKQTEKYTGPLPGGAEDLPEIEVMVRRPWPGALIQALPPTKPSKEATSYVFRCHPPRGKFIVEKAKQYKIHPAKYALLTQGQSILTDGGILVTPEMVMDPPKTARGFAVVDLPSDDYVEPLVSRDEWNSLDVMEGVGAIIWILGPEVANHPSLQRFMKNFSHIQHIISSTEHCVNRLSLDSSASSTLRLNKVDPRRYPIPIFDNEALPQGGPLSNSSPDMAIINAVPAQRGQIVSLEPVYQIQSERIIKPLDIDAVLNDVPKRIFELGDEARNEIAKDQDALQEWRGNTPCPNAEIITLGTGSAIPSKYRNVSATLMRVPGFGNYLFDCGENTLGQLKRVFPADELKTVFKDLRMIWVSHLHADHHLGTVSVIRAWYKAVHNAKPSSSLDPACLTSNVSSEKRLAVVSDVAMLNWLAEYSDVDDYGYSHLLPLHLTNAKPVMNENLPDDSEDLRSTLTFKHADYGVQPATPASLNLEDIQAVGVVHCHGAKAVSLTFANGFKASYSGDCRPSRKFAMIGKGSTVLIHEATFDDELKSDAKAKKHSTTSEALMIAEAMGARAVVLTHFSQRYQKVPVMEVASDEEMIDVNPATEIEAESDEKQEAVDPEGTAADDGLNINTESANPSDAVIHSPAKATVKIKNKDMKVCVAFDYMRVQVGEIAEMEKFTPALLKLFEWDATKEDKVGMLMTDDGTKINTEKGGKVKKAKTKRNN
ncbi:hypothetical protein M501DRAFT_1013075 [Patellaria atrata CBS 101060]|uniref:ribonuclease Z n=1 Tax=Patellaria atrata CBS 101060 TaxID=1346257 RepID=A0A9P4SK41_9PEZI|nr:hypothetical protein M501DRAFT_1013075 [Patellaria atrata CBS 101060]